MADRSGYSRCGSNAILELWCFFTLFWVSQLALSTRSAQLVKIENLGLFLVPNHSFFLHFRIRVWVRPTIYAFVCRSARVQARPSRLSPLEHPSCYWFEAVCRFNSVIIPVADEDIQRGEIGIGLDLCVFQCKQFRSFSIGTLVVTNWIADVGLHQKALTSLKYVLPLALWHRGYLPWFQGSIHVARMATCFDCTVTCLTILEIVWTFFGHRFLWTMVKSD